MKKITILVLIIGIITSSSFGAASPADSLKALLSKAGSQLYVKQYSEAIKSFEQALQLDSSNFEALQGIGTAHSATGNPEKARRYFERGHAVNPQNAEINNNLGVSFSSAREFEKAVKYFEMAVKYDTTSALYRANLGMEYLKMGRTIAGMPHLFRANELRPNQPEILFSIGNGYAASNRFDSAEFFYEASVKSGGQSADLFYFLGRIKDKLGKSSEAELDLKKALELKAEYPDCIRTLGILYVTEGRYTEATMQFERALTMDSTNPGNWIGLGAAYALEGRSPKADSILNMLMVSDTNMGNELLRIVRQERARQKEKSEK